MIQFYHCSNFAELHTLSWKMKNLVFIFSNNSIVSSWKQNICEFLELRGSHWNYWHPPSRTTTKDVFINLRFSDFKMFTVGVESFFRSSESRPEGRKKVNFWKETQCRPYYAMINFPSTQNCHSLRAFSQFWETGEHSRWIDDKDKVGEETVEGRYCREKFSKASQELLWKRRRSKWLIFRLFLPVPYTAYPSK